MERFFRPASRLVIINSKNQILLARHKRYWALPG
jgi:ADP-ribose pyrophosphatase YjhB (NUDIX family)